MYFLILNIITILWSAKRDKTKNDILLRLFITNITNIPVWAILKYVLHLID